MKINWQIKQTIWVTLLWCVSFPCLVVAQLTTGSISGTITDQSAAVVSGASVAVKNVGTGITRTALSDGKGHYEVSSLPAGIYEVTVSMTGFQSNVRSGIELSIGRNVVAGFELQVGDITQSVTVAGEVAQVETTTATVSHLVEEKQVMELPLNNRDLNQLTFLEPGVTKSPRASDIVDGYGDKISVAGARSNGNIYLLDGVSNGDFTGNAQGASGAYLGAETVKEFQVITNNYSAVYKNAPGAIISAVTKSGTNQFHGSLFEFVRNDNLDAANFFDNSLGRAKPEFKRNQFGGSAGGRIVRDRTFFFTSYEGLRERLGSTDTARIPTLAARQGNLPTGTITVSPAMKPYLDFYPVPGQGNSVTRDFRDGTVEIAGSTQRKTDDNFYAVRIDHQFSTGKAGAVWGTYNYDKTDLAQPALIGFRRGTSTLKHVVSVRHNSIWSNSIMNELSFGYSRTKPFNNFPIDQEPTTNLVFRPGRRFFGLLSTTNVTGIGYADEGQSQDQRIFSIVEGLSILRGPHSLKFGTQIDHNQWLQYSSSGNGFNVDYTFDSITALLTASPRLVEAQIPGFDDPNRNMRQLVLGFYVQDDYRVKPTFTLNLGLRYDFATVPDEADGKVSSLLNFSDRDVTVGKLLANATHRTFGPRIGFAWAPSSRLSIRGGAAIFYEIVSNYHLRSNLSAMSPFSRIGSASSTDAARAGTTIRFPDALQTQISLLSSNPQLRTSEYASKTPTMYRWSLTVQRDLGGNWVASAGYTGSRGTHLWHNTLPNLNRWQYWPDNTKPKFWPTLTGSNRINPYWGQIRMMSTNADSWHNDLAVGLQKRLGYGLAAQVAFTWSKTLDTASSNNGVGTPTAAFERTMFYWDMYRAKGPSGFDIPRSLTSNFTYEPLTGHHLAGWSNTLLGGWQVNGILSLSSGFRLGLIDRRSAQTTAFGEGENIPVDLIPNGNNNPVHGRSGGCVGIDAGRQLRTPELWYDPCQFVLGGVGYFGNLGRHTMQVPGIATLDFSIFKNINLTEYRRFQLRTELFNIFNNANFNAPNPQPFGATGARDLNAGRITSTRTPGRQVQFGLKFLF